MSADRPRLRREVVPGRWKRQGRRRDAMLHYCESCERRVGTFVPRGGDGSARRVYSHQTGGARCPGRWAKGWEG